MSISRPSRSTAPARSRLGFNGEYLEHHHLQILGSYRAYNPVLMRFHGPDSLSPFAKGGLNAYAYCHGDPVNLVDPTGHSVWYQQRMLSYFMLSAVGILTGALGMSRALKEEDDTRRGIGIALASLALATGVAAALPLVKHALPSMNLRAAGRSLLHRMRPRRIERTGVEASSISRSNSAELPGSPIVLHRPWLQRGNGRSSMHDTSPSDPPPAYSTLNHDKPPPSYADIGKPEHVELHVLSGKPPPPSRHVPPHKGHITP